MLGTVLAQAVPSIGIKNSLVAAMPLVGLALGLGIGRDGEVPIKLAQRLQPVGFALLALPYVAGLAMGREAYTLTRIGIAALAVSMGSLAPGQKLSESGSRAAS